MSKKLIVSCNQLEVEVTTNCPQGGDAGHGGITIFILKDVASTCWQISRIQDGIKLELYGDTECETFIKALRFAAFTLEQMVEKNEKTTLD